ncbi:hypothetical protein MUK42_25642 [Musa troglodytarum]|nr:hypothetical protein MUK42_25642 [Musa troglodytarum]
MPQHFPRYTKAQYENMSEAELGLLLAEYGIDFKGDLREERKFAMVLGSFHLCSSVFTCVYERAQRAELCHVEHA